MFSSMAAETPGISEQMKKDLDTITQETQRCAGIVRGLLDFGRESIPMKTFVSMNKILDKTLALVENQTLFQDVEITREYDERIPELEGDPNQLEQVFMNIIINAAQAMPAGGRLAIKTWCDEEMVMIRIADTGCGISGENLERIFDPFFTTKDQQGTGLGLSVSYGIVENHGGDIRVESRPSQGTAFTIRLPVNGGDKGVALSTSR